MDLVQRGFKRYIPFITAIIAVILLLIVANKLGWNKPQYRELTPVEMEEITQMRKDAYDYAVSCSNTINPALRFEQISWVLIPGDYLDVRTIDGRIKLKGLYNPTDSTIYLPFTERNTRWLAAHEILHAIGYLASEGGVHPSFPFRSCGLLVEQN